MWKTAGSGVIFDIDDLGASDFQIDLNFVELKLQRERLIV